MGCGREKKRNVKKSNVKKNNTKITFPAFGSLFLRRDIYREMARSSRHKTLIVPDEVAEGTTGRVGVLMLLKNTRSRLFMRGLCRQQCTAVEQPNNPRLEYLQLVRFSTKCHPFCLNYLH